MAKYEGAPGLEVRCVDEPVAVRDPDFEPFEGRRCVVVLAREDDGRWTRWEVVHAVGEHFAVLATRGGAGGEERLGAWPLPGWLAYPEDLLGGCRSVAEARAWLGADLPPPPASDPAWRFADPEDAEEREDDDDPYPWDGWRTVPDAAPRLVGLDDLPAEADLHFDYLADGIASKLPALDLGGYALLAASRYPISLLDPAGLDQDGGHGWRMVAGVRWAGREALLVGAWEEMDSDGSDPGRMRFTLVAPAEATGARAAALARAESLGGLLLPEVEWFHREEAAAPGKEPWEGGPSTRA
jgi:hypothetical protein